MPSYYDTKRDSILEDENEERCRLNNENEEKALEDYERFVKKLEDGD